MSAPVPLKNNPHGWFIIAAVMLATVMEILDTTIVNVSLPQMMGALSADRDQISWVLTSYIVAAGMLMPLTGFLVNRIGCKRLLLINIVGFMAASALCGLSVNLSEMVIFRLLQGVFGASLVPLSQFILRESFPPEDQPKVMAIWAVGIMAAPVMGPTLGGYITETLNWRWVFYINVPVCIINFFLVLAFIKQSPLKKAAIDWLGMILMLMSVGALQLFLDRGEVDDWFASSLITWLFIIFIVTFVFFLIHSLRTKNSIINLRLFADRNFAVGTLIMALFAASFLGCLTLLPQMQETLFGYTSNLTGLAMAPRGIASGIMMALASRLLMMRVDARLIIVAGLVISGYTTWMMSCITLDTGIAYMTIIGFIQGFGLGCFFMPLSAMIYTNLPNSAIAEASGLFSFGRSIGNAIGISMLTTYLDRDTQANWNILGGHLHAANTRLTNWLNVQHLSLNDPHAMARLGSELSRQANFVAYLHTYRIAAILLLITLAIVLLLKGVKRQALSTAAAH
ncbi:MAG: DHA2 family efflux MFS transporter permease subunit [Gammaproteobacteria bacterium]